MTRALGLDGCAAGWVAVLLEDDVVSRVEVVTDLAEAVERAKADAIGIDIPVGLLDVAARRADVEARRLLPGRASSVFNAPPRAVVEAHRRDPAGLDHAAASALARRVTGKGLSQQTWRLVPKIAEADDLVAAGVVLLEVHPEVAFAVLAGGPPLPRKTSWAGATARRAALAAVGVVLPDDFDGAGRCAPDDVLDAAVVGWVAQGRARGAPLVVVPPAPDEVDRGRAVAIHARRAPS